MLQQCLFVDQNRLIFHNSFEENVSDFARLHDDTNGLDVGVDNGIPVVIVIVGPVVAVVVFVGRRVGVDVGEEFGRSGQHLPKFGQEPRVFFFQAETKWIKTIRPNRALPDL